MGFFSWMTCDTNESISNQFSARGARTVYLLQPEGKPPIEEENYEGYGDFGGIDAYVWLATNNGLGATADRYAGIDLFFSDKPIEFPLKFSFNKDAVYEDWPTSKDCPDQGYFYDDEDYEEDDDDDDWGSTLADHTYEEWPEDENYEEDEL